MLLAWSRSQACDLSQLVPDDPAHPSSPIYGYGSKRVVKKFKNRNVSIYFPIHHGEKIKNATTIIFGHGKLAPRFTYEKMFRHLNGKGIAVVYPQYEKWALDSRYSRMAKDFADLSQFALETESQYLNDEKLVFSGHSNGAFIALLSAGMPQSERKINAKSLVLFALPGWREASLKRLDPELNVSIISGDNDKKTPFKLGQKIYEKIKTYRKQHIILKSFNTHDSSFLADHGAARTYSWTGPRINILHYHGYWQYLSSAALALDNPSSGVAEYLYGSKAFGTFCPDYKHIIHRSW